MAVVDINNRMISICPLYAAQCIGVRPLLVGVFGVSIKDINNFTISMCPFSAAV